MRIGASWRVAGGYLYEQAKVRSSPANPALVGNFLAQVPEHRGSLQVVYSNPRFLDLAFLVQALGMQFDDDLNPRTVPGLSEPGLPGYAVASFTASRAIGRNFEAFFGMQNLFGKANTSSVRCRPRSARRAWSPAGCGCGSPGAAPVSASTPAACPRA